MNNPAIKSLCLALLLGGMAAGCVPEDDPVIKVESVTIATGDLTLTEGEGVTLSAVVLPKDATDKTVKWSSSDERVVMVSSSGKVAAISAGKAVVTAKADEQSDFITVTVVAKTIPVTGISLDKPSITVTVDESEQLTATVTPADATNKNVIWSSSDTKVATVEDGKVAGVAPGTATVTARTEDGGKTAECAVTVEAKAIPTATIGANHISAVSAMLQGKADVGSTASSDLEVGFQYSTSPGILPSNSIKVLASSSNADYTYTSGITGLEPKTTYYYRSYVSEKGQDNYGETKSFTTKDLTSLIMTKSVTQMEAKSAVLNAKLDLTDVLSGSTEYGFFWGTSESDLDKKLSGGPLADKAYSAALEGLSPKTKYWFKAYVKLDDRTFYGDVLTFTTGVVTVKSVTLDQEEYVFHTIGNTITLNATVLPEDAPNKEVSWSSSDIEVATVSSSGVVKAVGNGEAVVTVRTKDMGLTATCHIYVEQYVTGISLDKTSMSLHIGERETLTATITPENANDQTLDWTSSNESVAKVNQYGRVTAVSNGTAVITASAMDGSGKSASCTVKVFSLVEGIELDKYSFVLLTDRTEAITATVYPSTADDKCLTWSSSNPSIATVSADGVVTGISSGTVVIEVTAKDGSGVSNCCEVEVKWGVTSIVLDKSQLSIIEGTAEDLTAYALPRLASDDFLWTSSDESVAVVNPGYGLRREILAVRKGTATITIAATDGSGVTATCPVTVVTQPVPEMVDLGLSVKWASFNIGAFSPEEFGSYFNWGETEPVKGVDWDNYKWCNGSGNTLTKYNTLSSYGTIDNKTVLETGPDGDDVASKVLGGKWRMPTDEEWTELMTECTLTWTSETSNNGTWVTGKNGNSIFIPAAGENYVTYRPNVQVLGLYWSSSLNVESPDRAWRICFTSGGASRFPDHRPWGRPVRAVYGNPPVHPESLSLNKSSLSLPPGSSEPLTVSVYPANASIKTVTWSSSNTSIATVSADGLVTAKATGTATITATATDGGASASCAVTVTYATPEMVDLGLSVKWASFNLGASSPEEYGYYYAWGETEQKDNYSYKTYKWCNGSETSLTKYNTKSSYGAVDNHLELDPEDDAAYVHLGGNWRMPTRGEVDELFSRCTRTWTASNGSYGYRFTGPNGNSIFLPLAGIRGGTSTSYAGSSGVIWSSSLYTDAPDGAYCLSYSSSNEAADYYYRCVGMTIRPVYGAPAVHVKSVTLNKTFLSLPSGRSEQLTATVSPADATNKTLTWTTSNTSVATVSSNGVVTAKAAGTATITVKAVDNGVSAICTVTVTPPEPEAVDLGLSVKWATYNVGATAPEQYGNYYAWGETTTKSSYDWGNYTFRTGGSSYGDLKFSKYNSLSGYGTVDNKKVLDLTDDVARTTWGGTWRMPTREEFDELSDNCTWEYTSINGVYGQKLTSKMPGYTDKWIFLPAAGRKDGSNSVNVGSRGYYWTSSHSVGWADKAYEQFFNSSDKYITVLERYFGITVRPVRP